MNLGSRDRSQQARRTVCPGVASVRWAGHTYYRAIGCLNGSTGVTWFSVTGAASSGWPVAHCHARLPDEVVTALASPYWTRRFMIVVMDANGDL